MPVLIVHLLGIKVFLAYHAYILHILEKDDQIQINFESFTRLNKYFSNRFFQLREMHAKYTGINNERLKLL